MWPSSNATTSPSLAPLLKAAQPRASLRSLASGGGANNSNTSSSSMLPSALSQSACARKCIEWRYPIIFIISAAVILLQVALLYELRWQRMVATDVSNSDASLGQANSRPGGGSYLVGTDLSKDSSTESVPGGGFAHLPPLSPEATASLVATASPPAVSSAAAEWVGLSALRAYAAWHKAAIEANLRGGGGHGYLVWRTRDFTGAGLGNRLIGAVSSLLLAMATQRIFLLQDDKIKSSGLLPHAIDYEHSGALQQAFAVQHSPAYYHHQVGMNVERNIGCEDLQVVWRGHKTVAIESTQYFVPLIMHNPHLRPALTKYFGAGTRMFEHLMPYVFKPSEQSIQHVTSYARQHMKRSVRIQEWGVDGAGWSGMWSAHARLDEPDSCLRVVGLQIRQQHLPFPDRERDVFKLCGQAVAQKLDNREMVERGAVNALGGSAKIPSLEQSSSAAAAAAGDAKVPHCSVSYFIASDQRGWIDGAGHWASSGDFPRLPWYEGPQGVVADILLLSLTDALVITFPRSTFGNVASGLMQQPAYAVESGASRRLECKLLLSTEPCYHGWFRRRSLHCYDEAAFETPDMLNFDNCYHCQALDLIPNGRCPADDNIPSEDTCARNSKCKAPCSDAPCP